MHQLVPWDFQPSEAVGANPDWGLTHLWGQNVAGRMRIRDSAGRADGTFAVAPSGPEQSGVRWVLGPEGYYLLLDNTGTADFTSTVVTAGDASGSAALGPRFSFAARVRFAGTSGVILGGSTGAFNVRLNSGKLEVSWSGLADLGAGNSVLATGIDYDIGVSFDGDFLRFFVNGVPDGVVGASATPTLQQTYIGARSPVYPGGEMLDNGSRIYWLATSNREWSPQQFAALAGRGWLQLWEPRRIWVPVSAAGGGGGVTGTLATTNASDTLAAAGTTTVAGSLARTNANDTLVAVGATTVTGSLAKTNANDSLAASGDVGGAVTGTLNRQNANDTLAAAGTTAVVGTVAATNAPDTLSAAGSTTVVGTLAKSNGNDTLQATGAAGSVTGSVAVTNRNDTLDARGIAGNPQQASGGYFGATPKSAKRIREDRIRFGVIPKPVAKAAKRVAAAIVEQAEESPLALFREQRPRFEAQLKQELDKLPEPPRWVDAFSLQIEIQIEAAQQRRRRQREDDDLLLMLL